MYFLNLGVKGLNTRPPIKHVTLQHLISLNEEVRVGELVPGGTPFYREQEKVLTQVRLQPKCLAGVVALSPTAVRTCFLSHRKAYNLVAMLPGPSTTSSTNWRSSTKQKSSKSGGC